MKELKFTAALVLGAVLLTTNNSLAAQIGASADTWVREDNATSNRNGDGFMNARTDIDADDNDVILLRFPTPGLAGNTLGATLTLYWQRDDGSVNSLSLWGLRETDPDETLWSEAAVTYNDAPGLIRDGDNPTVEFGLGHTDNDIRDLDELNLTLLVENQSYGPQVLNQAYSFSSSALTDFINADSNGEVTFLITRGVLGTSANQARFWQKEAGLSPILDVTLVPEPSTFALLGLGGLALVLRRRS